jgi:hypothetical protein
MACKTCSGSGSKIYAPCRCCQLVDSDNEHKSVRYCSLCKVYLCDACWSDIPKRIRAFGQSFFN